MSQGIPRNAKPNTTSTGGPGQVYKGLSNPTAVYRALELPLPSHVPSPLSFGSEPGGSKPMMMPTMVNKQPTKTTQGSVMWSSSQAPPPQGLFTPGRFHLQMDVKEMETKIPSTLDTHQVDFTLVGEFEWECEYVLDFIQVSFMVRGFDTGLVDFQRESGCPSLFQHVFDCIQSDLGEKTAPKPSRGFRALAMPKEMKMEPTCHVSSLEALVNTCCASQYVDVQRDSLQTLSRLLGTPGVSLSSQAKLRLLQTLISSSDPMVRRLAATCVGHESGERFQVGEKEATQLIKLLECAETKEFCNQLGNVLLHSPRDVRALAAKQLAMVSCRDQTVVTRLEQSLLVA